MVNLKKVADLRAENLRRSAAAGVAAGDRSEVDMNIRPGFPRLKKKRRKAMKAKGRRKKLSRAERARVAHEKAMSQWQRLPGSFENGKRR